MAQSQHEDKWFSTKKVGRKSYALVVTTAAGTKVILEKGLTKVQAERRRLKFNHTSEYRWAA